MILNVSMDYHRRISPNWVGLIHAWVCAFGGCARKALSKQYHIIQSAHKIQSDCRHGLQRTPSASTPCCRSLISRHWCDGNSTANPVLLCPDVNIKHQPPTKYHVMNGCKPDDRFPGRSPIYHAHGFPVTNANMAFRLLDRCKFDSVRLLRQRLVFAHLCQWHVWQSVQR
jgi:hypothetical protein